MALIIGFYDRFSFFSVKDLKWVLDVQIPVGEGCHQRRADLLAGQAQARARRREQGRKRTRRGDRARHHDTAGRPRWGTPVRARPTTPPLPRIRDSASTVPTLRPHMCHLSIYISSLNSKRRRPDFKYVCVSYFSNLHIIWSLSWYGHDMVS
jgi:hypothetical protein